MQINDLLAIGIVGVFLSFLIELLQAKFGTGKNATKALTIALAFVVGSAYYFLKETPYWVTIIGVLTAASTVYAFFFSSRSSKPLE